MKITVTHKDAKKVLDFYNVKLFEKFGSELLNLSIVYLMQVELDKLQSQMARIESSPIWRMPVEVIASFSKQEFDVVFKNPEGINFI